MTLLGAIASLRAERWAERWAAPKPARIPLGDWSTTPSNEGRQ